MSSGMLSLDSCPRDKQNLLTVPRGVRYRLAYQLGMFADDSQEMAFNGATDDQQCEALAAGLSQFDERKGVPSMAQQPQQMQQPQMQQPPQFPMQQPQQPPYTGQPVMSQQPQPQPPQQVQQVQYPQPQQPVYQPQPQQPMYQPQQPQPQQMVTPPHIPTMQQPPAPPSQQQQQLPLVAQAPLGPSPDHLPPRQPPGDPRQGAALPVMRTMSEALKKVAEVNEANQQWLQQLQEQGHMHTRLLEVLLRLLLARYGQENLDIKLLTSLVGQVKNEEINNLLSQLNNPGKGQ